MGALKPGPLAGRFRASSAGVVPLVVKGVSGQTANLLEAHRGDDLVAARVNSVGSAEFEYGLAARGSSTFANASILAAPKTATERGLIVKAAASHSSNLVEIQNSAGTVQSLINAVGGVRIGPGSESIGAWLGVQPSSSDTGLIVRAASGQIANLTELRLDNGTIASSFSADGRFFIHVQGVAYNRLVEFGGPDSAGTGYRSMRVAN